MLFVLALFSSSAFIGIARSLACLSPSPLGSGDHSQYLSFPYSFFSHASLFPFCYQIPGRFLPALLVLLVSDVLILTLVCVQGLGTPLPSLAC